MFTLFDYGSLVDEVFPDLVNTYYKYNMLNLNPKSVDKFLFESIKEIIERDTVLPYYKKIITASCIPCNNWRQNRTGFGPIDDIIWTYRYSHLDLNYDFMKLNSKLTSALTRLSRIEDYYIVQERSIDSTDLNKIISNRYGSMIKQIPTHHRYILDDNMCADREKPIPNHIYSTVEQLLIQKGLP